MKERGIKTVNISNPDNQSDFDYNLVSHFGKFVKQSRVFRPSMKRELSATCCILGHLTTLKSSSNFEILNFWPTQR